MSDKNKKLYSSEFKESSVKLAIGSKIPIAHTAKELGVNPNTLYSWIDKYTKPKEATMRTDQHIYDEVKHLKKELARVTWERDLLKKAAAYFAKDFQ
jgi:transposase